ncbi:MAG: efflux RND transporter periplasmic adaptor subunit [Planctomycetes bacterium]|nr:efflux RND transporter periplasmic adaptor subunit [Planctomycetota bacterium]
MRRIVIPAAALAAGLIFCGDARAQMGGPAPVYLEPAEVRTLRRAVELTGVAEARRRSVVSAEVSGRVEKMDADAGDFAAAGAPVCRMRRLPVELQLKQAEAALAVAQAQLRKAEEGFRAEEIRQADARVKAAQAAFDRAKQDFDRTMRLLADGASTPAERETAEAAYRQAREQLAEAQAGLALYKSGTRAEDIEAARAQAAAQSAAVESLRDTLDKMTVAMPFDGFIVRKRAEEGEWLSPGSAVVEAADLGVVRIQVDVPERYLAGLRKGSEAPVVFEALGDREFKGAISQIVPQAAEGTHTIPVRVDVPNAIEGGRPVIAAGLLARVWLPVGEEHQALLVPKAAIIRQQGRDLVYTVSDVPPPGSPAVAAPGAAGQETRRAPDGAAGSGTAANQSASGAGPSPVGPPLPPVRFAVAVPVRLIQGYGRCMEVESDRLKAGTAVVTRGTYLLADGAAVREFPKEKGGDAGAGVK